jgi:hypothetical protein
MRKAVAQYLRLLMCVGNNERLVSAWYLVCAVNVKSLLPKATGMLPLRVFFVGVTTIDSYNATRFFGAHIKPQEPAENSNYSAAIKGSSAGWQPHARRCEADYSNAPQEYLPGAQTKPVTVQTFEEE